MISSKKLVLLFLVPFFVLIALFLLSSIPILNSPIANLYLTFFGREGKLLFPDKIHSPVFSRNSHYAITDLEKGVGLIDLGKDKLEILDDESRLGSAKVAYQYPNGSYPFSPSGQKVLYASPVKERVTAGQDGHSFIYFYDIYVYDILTRQRTVVTDKIKGLLLNTYNQEISYGWVDDNNVAYYCDTSLGYGHSGRVCYFSLDNRTITSNSTYPEFLGTDLVLYHKSNPHNRLYDCEKNFSVDNAMCFYKKYGWHGWDGTLFEEIWLKTGNNKILLARSKKRADDIYWSADNKVYATYGINERLDIYQLYP